MGHDLEYAKKIKAQLVQDVKMVDALVEELKNREMWFNLPDFKEKQQTTTTHYESHKAIIFVLKKLLGNTSTQKGDVTGGVNE